MNVPKQTVCTNQRFNAKSVVGKLIAGLLRHGSGKFVLAVVVLTLICKTHHVNPTSIEYYELCPGITRTYLKIFSIYLNIKLNFLANRNSKKNRTHFCWRRMKITVAIETKRPRLHLSFHCSSLSNKAFQRTWSTEHFERVRFLSKYFHWCL